MNPAAIAAAYPGRTPYELALLQIMVSGTDRDDRTGTGTRGLFGLQMRWNLAEGFPLITTKKVFMRGLAEELLWMLRGCTDNHELVAKDVHIWDAWAGSDGELGPIYGAQWRSWEGSDGKVTDQISWVINEIKTNPNSRRLVVSAWNVADLPKMALAPCHCLFQFFVAEGKLSCQLYQRSADMFLGVPFNIASYALLTHMIAQQCGLKVGEFVWTGGDCHIYHNHFDQVQVQVMRTPFASPTLNIRGCPPSIFEYTYEDFELLDYKCHPAIKAPVAV